LIAVAFATLWFGGFVFWLLVAAGGLLMMGEWADLTARLCGRSGSRNMR
jgi:phosphatidate cytidylyltransferase